MSAASALPLVPRELPPALTALLASGLRGRGGGWFPAGRKWRAVWAEEGEPEVIANGAEGEPGSIKDRYLMRTRPADVLAGLALAARTLGARRATVYLKGSFAAEAAALEGARGGVDLAGVELAIHRGEDGYIVGEETALLESLEGRRAWPRPKPPLPAQVGLCGRPTLVQNVETLAYVPAAVADPDGFRAGETTLVTVWGHVQRPGVYRVRLGTPLRDVIAQAGGAAEEVGLVFPGGPNAAPVLGTQLDLPLDPVALRQAGSGLGTAALLVIGARVCPLAAAVALARFFERESCGQCPPCSIGAASLSRIVGAVEAGTARARELADLAEVAGFMGMHGYCAHSRTGAAAVSGLLQRVPQAVEEHLLARRCPRPGPECDPFAPGSPERRAVEAALGAA